MPNDPPERVWSSNQKQRFFRMAPILASFYGQNPKIAIFLERLDQKCTQPCDNVCSARSSKPWFGHLFLINFQFLLNQSNLKFHEKWSLRDSFWKIKVASFEQKFGSFGLLIRISTTVWSIALNIRSLLWHKLLVGNICL